MKELSVEEFVAGLDKTNPRFDSIRDLFSSINRDNYRIAKKSDDFVEVVKQFAEANRWPVIDKKMQMIIGCYAHRHIRAELYRYHKRLEGLKIWYNLDEENRDHADSYTQEGMGYHFTSMGPWQKLTYGKITPLVSRAYKPDRHDKDLFLFCEDPDFFS